LHHFVAALREVTPPDLQYVVTDLFESIVLFDNKAESASYTETPDHKFKVKLQVCAQNKKADRSGNETLMSINDMIDVGVFSGDRDHLKELQFGKQRISQEKQTFEFVVNERPTLAGIDPHNKLIDRNPGDNLIAVEKE